MEQKNGSHHLFTILLGFYGFLTFSGVKWLDRWSIQVKPNSDTRFLQSSGGMVMYGPIHLELDFGGLD